MVEFARRTEQVGWKRTDWITPRRVIVGVVALAVLVVGWVLWRPACVKYRVLVARRALARVDGESAWNALTAAERLEPQHAEIQFLLAKAARRTGRLIEAAQHLKQANQAGWPRAALVREQHLLAVQAGHFQHSEAYLRQLLASGDPDEVEIFEACAKGYLQSYRLGEAMDCFAYWIARRPHDFQPYFWRAGTWERLGERQQALADYQATVRLKPDHVEARRNLGDMLLEFNRLREAVVEYERCRMQDPSNADARLGLAHSYRLLSQTSRARQILQELVLQHPDHPDSLTEMGQLALAENQLEEALKWLDRAISLAPQNPTTHYAIGQALARCGRPQAAQEHFEQARKIREDMARMETIRQHLLTTPGDTALRYEAGVILMRHGQSTEGVRWLLTALQYDPDHQPTHEVLARYFEEQGQPNRAAEHRRLASAKPSPDSPE